MSRTARHVLVVVALAGLGALLIAALVQAPAPSAPPPPSAKLSTSVAVHERHVTDTVAGVTFDLRGFDTLGEELILFAAAGGASILLRRHRRSEREGEDVGPGDGDHEPSPAEQRSAPAAPGADPPASVQALGSLLVAPMLVFGAYIVSHGNLTPGGGFQGGVILVGALLLASVAGGRLVLRRTEPTDVFELLHAVGAAAFATMALLGLIIGGVVLTNFIALGVSGHLLSGGTILVLQVVVGVEVAAAVALIFVELLEQSGPQEG